MTNEWVDVLIKAGLKKNEAKVLLFLFENKKTVSRTIEEETVLRQPEVSNVLTEFSKRHWVARKGRIKKTGKGRPEVLFSLVKSKEQIFDELRRQLKQKLGSVQNAINELDKKMPA